MTTRELLERSLAELQDQLERHQQFVRTALNGEPLEPHHCPWSACRHQQLLSSVLLDAVRVLEDTRKAFKSKQLEALRKNLLRVLAEETEPVGAGGKSRPG